MLNSIGNFLPEIALVLVIIIIPLNEVLFKKYKFQAFHIAVAGIALSLLFSIIQIWSDPSRIFGSMSVIDPFSVFAKIVIEFSVLAILLISKKAAAATEYYIFITSLTLGCLLAASSVNMIMLYVSFALVDLSLFFLISIDRISSPTSNSHIKFVTYTIVASIVMLLGMSILYGLAGSMDYYSISTFLSVHPFNATTLLFAMLLILTGFASRMLLVPFHFSASKIIESSPLPAFAVLTGPVIISGFISFARFFITVLQNRKPEGFEVSYSQIPGLHLNRIIMALAIITLLYSSFAIWKQKKLRKIIFYIITIQSALLTVALSTASIKGIPASLILITVFCITGIGLIYILNAIETIYKTDGINELAGNGKTNKLLFSVLIILLISSAGVPVTFGFTSRLFLYTALINSESVWLIVIMVINTVIMAFYSLKILKDIFILDPKKNAGEISKEPSENIPQPLGRKLILLIILLPAILFGLYFEPLIKIAEILSKIYGI